MSQPLAMPPEHGPDGGPLVPGGPVSTGVTEVDTVLAGLPEVVTLPPAEQVTWYSQAHRALSETLRTIDAT